MIAWIYSDTRKTLYTVLKNISGNDENGLHDKKSSSQAKRNPLTCVAVCVPSLWLQPPRRHPPLWVPPNSKYKTECPVSVRDTSSLVQIVKKAALIPASKYVRIASRSIREKFRIRAAFTKFGKCYGFFHFITWSIRRVSGKDFFEKKKHALLTMIKHV
jgi:hypothetical protein